MIEKYGSEQAVKDEMRRRQLKSRENYKGTGGFAHMSKQDPDKFKQVSSRGGRSGKV
jgi:hypothetical protein